MAVIDLRNAPRDERGLVEQGSGYIPSYSQSGNVPSCDVPSFQVDIRREIYIFVMNAGRAVSRAEIAKAVNRKKSTWLDGVIEGMVWDGYLSRIPGVWKNGCVMYFYEVNQ